MEKSITNPIFILLSVLVFQQCGCCKVVFATVFVYSCICICIRICVHICLPICAHICLYLSLDLRVFVFGFHDFSTFSSICLGLSHLSANSTRGKLWINQNIFEKARIYLYLSLDAFVFAYTFVSVFVSLLVFVSVLVSQETYQGLSATGWLLVCTVIVFMYIFVSMFVFA